MKTRAGTVTADWTPIAPAPADAPPPKLPDGYEAYPYRTQAGDLYGYVCRWLKDGRPQVKQLNWARNGSPESATWRWLQSTAPRPLYGIELVEPGNAVLVAPDERTCGIARTLLEGTNTRVVTWHGPAADTDWQPLAGHIVTLWPAPGATGDKHADAIVDIIGPITVAVLVFDLDAAAPQNDLETLQADGWTQAQLLDLLGKHTRQRHDAPPERSEAPDAPEPIEPPDASSDVPAPAARAPDDPPFPFTLLGHDHGLYFYLGHAAKQVTILKANAHTALNLLQLAPQSFWVRRWPTKKGFDSETAASDLMQIQHALGIYDPARLRGRGAWWDKRAQTALIHLGDRLLIDGKEIGLHDHGTEHIYECAVPIAVDLDHPLSNREANVLVGLCERISWEIPFYARLLAGWIVCAQVCGALRWKPNAWIQGPAGSGKTTIVDHIVGRALGRNACKFVGGTTEPALRNVLKADAMPIILDDLDSATDRGRQANQAILALMRVFSAEDSGALAKGNQSGVASVYRVHSCYLFCSIAIEADKSADTSRIQVLRLAKRDYQKGQLEELHAAIAAALPPEFAPRFFARCIRQIPAIRHNASVFAGVVAGFLNSQRSGDVIGHLLAGCYSLFKDGLVTPEEAAAFVGNREEVKALLVEQKQANVEASEGERCLYHLCETTIMDSDNGRTVRATVFELLRQAKSTNQQAAAYAEGLLLRHGVAVDGAHFYIANEHSELRRIYRESHWAVGWGGVLKTIRDASAGGMVRFGARTSRSTKVPFSLLASAPAAQVPLLDREPGSD